MLHSFSIVIAARNEEKNIARLLDSLFRMDYPKDKFEVIVVDDRSNDSTKEIVKKFEQQASNVKIISIVTNDTDMPHKKNALRTGIQNARFDILTFTDADCIVPKQWLKKLSEQFTDEVGAVAGYSPFEFDDQKTPFNSFLRYEEFKGSITAAAAIGGNNAFMCTGRNFAYRRKVYDAVGGFEKIKQSVSGDDDLFIQLIRRETPWEVRYMTSPESFVITRPPLTFNELVNQRTRHISASKYYAPRVKFFFGLSHIYLFTSIVALFVAPLFGLIFLLVRINGDALFIARGKEIFNEEFSVVEFFRNEFLLILYLFFIGPMGFLKKYEWKL
ncbi:MAG: glycosyltransferase [Ignavibacteriales bacterium]|nr:glycosyltransferase [Ignavibacteriales bacterium]